MLLIWSSENNIFEWVDELLLQTIQFSRPIEVFQCRLARFRNRAPDEDRVRRFGSTARSKFDAGAEAFFLLQSLRHESRSPIRLSASYFLSSAGDIDKPLPAIKDSTISRVRLVRHLRPSPPTSNSATTMRGIVRAYWRHPEPARTMVGQSLLKILRRFRWHFSVCPAATLLIMFCVPSAQVF